jgi:hypothetical protein
MRRSVLIGLALLLGLAAFCVVQDRVTAEGARRYVRQQRAAENGNGVAPPVDDVMRPAIAASVREGATWGGGVAAAGVALALLFGKAR